MHGVLFLFSRVSIRSQAFWRVFFFLCLKLNGRDYVTTAVFIPNKYVFREGRVRRKQR